MVLDHWNIFCISFISFNILIELCPVYLCFVRLSIKMSPEPAFFATSK